MTSGPVDGELVSQGKRPNATGWWSFTLEPTPGNLDEQRLGPRLCDLQKNTSRQRACRRHPLHKGRRGLAWTDSRGERQSADEGPFTAGAVPTPDSGLQLPTTAV